MRLIGIRVLRSKKYRKPSIALDVIVAEDSAFWMVLPMKTRNFGRLKLKVATRSRRSRPNAVKIAINNYPMNMMMTIL